MREIIEPRSQTFSLLSDSGFQPSLESARIPPFGLPESDLLILTFAIQLRCLAHPFIGTVRANPFAAPVDPVNKHGMCYL